MRLAAPSTAPEKTRSRPRSAPDHPGGKYWICKTAPAFIYEAMECLGGNGYVEEGVLPRLYREAPVNAIWEGSGNVMCLDVLRALDATRRLPSFLHRWRARLRGFPARWKHLSIATRLQARLPPRDGQKACGDRRRRSAQ